MSAQLPYQEFADFNEFLDNNDENVVQVDGYTFTPSLVLYTMNYEQYIEAYENYLADDNVLIQEVSKDFPTPVAFYLAQAEENYDSAHHRLDLLKSTWESLVFIIFGIVVGEARHRKVDLKAIGVKFSDYFTNKLNTKLKIVENILDYCDKNTIDFNCAKIISITTISKLIKLNQERNGFEHTFAKTPDQQRELYTKLRPELIKVLRDLRNMERVNLIRHHSNDDGIFYPRCDGFNGESLSGKKKTVMVTASDIAIIGAYFNRSSIFCELDGLVFCVSPFIHFNKEPADAHPSICFYKDHKHGKYVYEIVGRSEEKPFEINDFADRENELRALII
jgi:hypothetical protein